MSPSRHRRYARLSMSAFMALFVLTPIASQAEDEAPIGRVKTSSGAAFLIRGEQRKAAEIGDPVHRNETLETGPEGSLGVVFRDETRVSLGPDTQLVVAEYLFAPERQEASFITRMTRGTLLFVSGLISKVSPESTKVQTPAGILGVRGTRFLVKLEASAD